MKNKSENLSSISEFGLIENIKDWIDDKESCKNNFDEHKNIIGIGDDAAVIKNFNGNLLSSIDTLVEDIHFTTEITNFTDLGWKSLAVNISDIAAMGGIPKFAMISFACPSSTPIENLKKFYFGFKELCDLANVKLVGGDTVKTNAKIVVSVAILGETVNDTVFLRSAAKNGDYVCATGYFGDAAAGLKELLLDNSAQSYFTQKFNRPMPRFKEAKILADKNLANAMIDSSDGLIFSLYEIAEKSKVGIMLDESKIPLSKEILKLENAQNLAFYGGEDYELVFSVSKNKIDEVLSLLENVKIIGEISKNFEDVKMKSIDGKIKILEKKGYSAF